MNLGIVHFSQWTCKAILGSYRDGRSAISLVEQDTGLPVATATVNAPHAPLDNDEVLIKDYAENAGMLEALVAAGIVEPTGRVVPVGFECGHVCKLKYEP